jgi:hypothetical protein
MSGLRGALRSSSRGSSLHESQFFLSLRATRRRSDLTLPLGFFGGSAISAAVRYRLNAGRAVGFCACNCMIGTAQTAGISHVWYVEDQYLHRIPPTAKRRRCHGYTH